ncbi:hypothetical protein NPIL_458951 [Nephila pilipes]|uniref:Uncharacterized protein n=1 Tax=Nephila pilipes TaxID=299642 RepID=A0A8X6UL21_NEPPI|nr:hypothetical protein NPIL_458951 [Nephila pilipes]
MVTFVPTRYSMFEYRKSRCRGYQVRAVSPADNGIGAPPKGKKHHQPQHTPCIVERQTAQEEYKRQVNKMITPDYQTLFDGQYMRSQEPWFSITDLKDNYG